MAFEEEKLQNIKNNMDELSRRNLNLALFDEQSELLFHNYIRGICQRLLGDKIDLEKEQIMFALSDTPKVNAAFAHEENRYLVIYITEPLFNMCENEDQLAFILAHELGHMEEYMRQGLHLNTKAEETAADLRAIRKMANAGYNLEEAHKISAKLFDNPLMDIESLKDPHANDTSRKNAVDAAIIHEKQRIIEEKQTEVRHTSPISNDIKRIMAERTVPVPFEQRLQNDIRQAKDTDKATQIWLNAFHDRICEWHGQTVLSRDDIRAFCKGIRTICTDKSETDKFLAAVIADVEKHRGQDDFQAQTELLSNLLYEIYSYDSSPTKVDADEKDSRTAAILRRYLTGFRTAEGDDYKKMIQRFDFVNKFVAKSYFENHRGILVENFNLLELEFNENDLHKKISPEICQCIKDRLNALNRFETFSGLTISKMGNNLLFTQGKKQWCTFVNNRGIIEYSFPAKDLQKMQTRLMAKTVDNTYHDILNLRDGKTDNFDDRLTVLQNAYSILKPPTTLNNLTAVLEIRGDKKDNNEILLEDFEYELPPDTRKFFRERSLRPYNLKDAPYTSFVVHELADCIRRAPKEKFETLLTGCICYQNDNFLSGQEELIQAFLDNPAFFDILQQKIRATALLPQEKDEWDFSHMLNRFDENQDKFLLLNLVDEMKKVSDLKLEQHLAAGNDFATFTAPFGDRVRRLCGFGNGELTEDKLMGALEQARNIDRSHASLLARAYMLAYSYDALKSTSAPDLKKTFGTNIAGLTLAQKENVLIYRLQEPEKYHIDDKEKAFLKTSLDTTRAAIDKIRGRLSEQAHIPQNWSTFNGSALLTAVLYNDPKSKNFGFQTLAQNKDLMDLLLEKYPDEIERFSCILALSHIANASEKDEENDRIKQQIWPVLTTAFSEDDDIRKKIKTFLNLSENKLFASDNKNYYDTLVGRDGKGGLLAELEQAPASVQANCYISLLNKNCRIPDPEIRNAVIHKAARAWHKTHKNYNDIAATAEERAKILQEIDALQNKDIAETDLIELMKELSEQMLSQKELSLAMKPRGLDLQTSDSSAIAAAYGLDGLAYIMQHYPNTKKNMQNFLLGEGSATDAADLIREIKLSICTEADRQTDKNLKERLLRGEDISDDIPFYVREYYNKLNVENTRILKKEFDAAPLEAKALIVNELLTTGKSTWKDAFDNAADRLFAGAGNLSKIGSDFLYSYISARPDSEKTFYLAAMMSAVNKNKTAGGQYSDSPYTPEQRNLARGLRLFLESSGPAGTKLAQAMSSYAEVPDFIRHEMQFAKSQANPPARWEIFSGHNQTTDQLLKYGPLGARRGSASFFVTYELGDKIVKILRRGAQIKADNEFAVYASMLDKLKENYDNISSFRRLVQNAADNVRIETDLEIGHQQLQDAKRLYPQTAVADNVSFNIRVMDWVDRGKDWAVMEKARGLDFKDLPQPYKTAAAKAVFTTELTNMLSGKRFDSDRHGGQYKIDPETNTIGVFDTGSMSTIEPSAKEQQALGAVLARTLKHLRRNPDIAAVFSRETDLATNEFYKDEIDRNLPVPPYLSEFQRGLLALSDFYGELSTKDRAQCVIRAVTAGHHSISNNISAGFKNEIVSSLQKHNQTLESILYPEKSSTLAPEARANRRIGKVLFDALYHAAAEGKAPELTPELKEKILLRLNNPDNDLQIIKGIVRGAAARLNPENYTVEDRRQLGALLYRVCRSDITAGKMNKETDIEKTFTDICRQTPNLGEYGRNIENLLKLATQIPSIDGKKIKRAALFITFADKEVAKGYRQALNEDKSVNIGKRLLYGLQPMSFIPRGSKKLLIRTVGKKMVLRYLNQKLFGEETPKDMSDKQKQTER